MSRSVRCIAGGKVRRGGRRPRRAALASLLLAVACAAPVHAGQISDTVPGASSAAADSTGAPAGRSAAMPSGAAPPQAPILDSLDGARYGTLSGRRAAVRFAAGDSLVAERVLALLEEQPPLPGLPDSVPAGVVAVLAHTPAAFDELTGGAVPEWRAGVAVPARRLLVVPTGEGPRILDGEGRRTLRHEWAHLGLHASLEGLRVPRWFDEGYAQWASGGFDATEGWRLRLLLLLGRAPPMDSLELRWPARREEARTAYLLSASAVTFLLEPSGERGLAYFLDRWRAERSFDRALGLTFGVTATQFEANWKRHVRRRYGWLSALGHAAVFWALLAMVLLFMVRLRRGDNMEKMARMRATEPPDEPAYWMDAEPPDGPGGPSPGV